MHEVGRFPNRILGIVFCELNCVMVISSAISFNIINTYEYLGWILLGMLELKVTLMQALLT